MEPFVIGLFIVVIVLLALILFAVMTLRNAQPTEEVKRIRAILEEIEKKATLASAKKRQFPREEAERIKKTLESIEEKLKQY